MATKSRITLTSSMFLVAGLVFVFVYAAVMSFRHPLEWVGYVPGFLTRFVAALTLVKLIAAYELVLAAWLLSGRYRKYAALLSAATLGGIIVLNWGQMIVTFRDVGLLCMALALFLE